MPYNNPSRTEPPPFLSFCNAVLLCAGEGSRYLHSARHATETAIAQKTDTPSPNKLLSNKLPPNKLLAPLGGKPALQHLCESVQNAGFARILLVLPQHFNEERREHREHNALGTLVSTSLPDAILVEGGARRQDSLLKALEALEAQDKKNDLTQDHNPWVMVFDAARPLVSSEMIARVAQRAKTLCERSLAACVVPLVSVVDSVKRVSKQGRVCASVAREDLRLAQTPQAAPRALLLRLLRDTSATVSDETQLCLAAGCLVEAVEGEAAAHKITTLADVALLEGLLEGSSGRPASAMPEYRSATGFDLHKIAEGASLRLCGVDVAAPFSLQGHSDADVGLHALTDALLSLAGAGDIGDLFPPTDEQWRDADSALFLSRATELLAEAGGQVVSLDVTLLLETPHLGQAKLAMRTRLAELTGLTMERVGVKATTLEGVGALGRKEGVGAFATASARFGAPMPLNNFR